MHAARKSLSAELHCKACGVKTSTFERTTSKKKGISETRLGQTSRTEAFCENI